MKIGVWIPADYQPTEGGGFSYFDRLVKAIDAYSFDKDLDVCYVTTSESPLLFKREVVRLTAHPRGTLTERIKKHLPLVGWHFQQQLTKRLAEERFSIYRQQLVDNGVRILYYPSSGRDIPNFPFIATNWDIGHLSTYAFPEVSMDGQFKSRNHYYTSVLPQALMVFCESEAGKQELIRFTNIKEDKLRVVPIFAGGCIDEVVDVRRQTEILEHFQLKKNRFFFYPAQFWAHKNHFGVLRALKDFVITHPDFKLVLTGSDHGNLAYVKKLINEYSLNENVAYLGFVDMDTVYTLYRNAAALVMASYFGPTNMPPLEAISLGCPVICTDLAGHHEELGDAALYFDAKDAAAICTCMKTVVADNVDFRKKVEGQSKKTDFRLEIALSRINKYFIEASNIRATWDQ